MVLTLINPNSEIRGGGGGGWDWMPGDFVIMGALLFLTGLAIDFALRKIANPTARIIAVAAILFALLVIWAELAVDAVSRALDTFF